MKTNLDHLPDAKSHELDFIVATMRAVVREVCKVRIAPIPDAA